MPSDSTGWTTERLFDSNIVEWVGFEFAAEVVVNAISFKVNCKRFGVRV